MESFDASLHDLVERWRGRMPDEEIIIVLKDEVESLQEATKPGDGAH
jgi:hypothetical protein